MKMRNTTALDSRFVGPEQPATRSVGGAVPTRSVGTSWVVVLLCAAMASAAEPPKKKLIREIFVPFEDLNVLLEGDVQRVFLKRADYDELIAKAKKKKTPEAVPTNAAVLAAKYEGQIENQRLKLNGEIEVEVLAEGVQAVPLELAGLGVRKATLDEKPAALGRGDGQITLFVEGIGKHKLTLEMVAAVATSAAQQMLDFQIPTPANTRLTLTVPGNVELKSGGEVVKRTLDVAAKEDEKDKTPTTKFELLPHRGRSALVMSLNNKVKRDDRAVIARSVVMDEITAAYERLHATVSLRVLHGAIERAKFAVPAGFEISEVTGPQVAKWIVESMDAGQKQLLDVTLREATSETVVLNIAATKVAPPADGWKLPQWQPLDVDGQDTVVGLLVEDRLKVESLASSGLIPIDTSSLTAAFPESLFKAEPGAPPIRPVVSYYAPQGKYELSARFARPPAKVQVTTALLLTLTDKAQLIRGGFTLVPEVEKLFAFQFTSPPHWQVTSVTDEAGQKLVFETYDGRTGSPSYVRVRLPAGVAVDQPVKIYFHATATPPGWLGNWRQRAVEFPTFAVEGATTDEGAIAVALQDDLDARPDKLTQLTPLDDSGKARFGLDGQATKLAFSYEARPYVASLAVERNQPTITARTYSFLRVGAEHQTAHYELVYHIERARTRRLSLDLPAGTPHVIAIRGLDGVVVKEYHEQTADARPDQSRRWLVELAEPRAGQVRLAVDFEFDRPLAKDGPAELVVPIVRAADVAYQSGVVAVDGDAELDIELNAENGVRRVDVGELAAADYDPGRRLLGAFGFVGDSPRVTLAVTRRDGYGLPPAIVQRAEIATVISTSGRGQSSARFLLRTKSPFLEVSLPADATLWAVNLDGKGIAPQTHNDAVLISLPSRPAHELRDLRIVFESPLASAGPWRQHCELVSPRLFLRETNAERERIEVPLADLKWTLYKPHGYRLVDAGGTVFTELRPREMPYTKVARAVTGAMRRAAEVPYQVVAVAGEKHSKFSQIAGTMMTDDSRSMNAYDMPPPTAMPMEAPPAYPSGGPGGPGGGGMGGGGVFAPGMGMGPGGAPMPESRTPMARDYAERARAQAEEQSKVVDELQKHREDYAKMPPPAKTEPAAPRKPMPPQVASTPVPQSDESGRLMAYGDYVEGATTERPRPTRPQTGSGVITGHSLLGGVVTNGRPVHPADGLYDPHSPAEAKPESKLEKDSRDGETKGGGEVAWALQGIRSLRIDVNPTPTGEAILFRSLGVDPKLSLVLLDEHRVQPLAWAVGLGVGLAGLCLTLRPWRVRAKFVIFVALVALAVPLLDWLHEFDDAFDAAFFAVCWLTAFYLAIAVAKLLYRGAHWLVFAMAARMERWWKRRPTSPTSAPGTPAAAPTPVADFGEIGRQPPSGPGPAAVVTTCLLLALSLATSAVAQQPISNLDELKKLLDPDHGPPVKLPADAIIIPYDAGAADGVKTAEKVLVPYDKYVELWNLAFPGQPIKVDDKVRPPAPFALAGATYSATLDGTEFLLVSGVLEFDLFVPETVTIPLGFSGGVLSQATLDGKPANLVVTQPAPAQGKGKPVAAAPIATLYASGKGHKQLELSIRIPLSRAGGWRIANARLPTAPATALNLRVPEAKTEVRLSGVDDRTEYETATKDQTLETALAFGGDLGLRWRPKTAEGQVDAALNVDSLGLVDVQEDGIRLVWQLTLRLRNSQRETFSVVVPAGYLVERVVGDNVRGWKADADNRVDVTLLKAATDAETFSLVATRRGAVGQELTEFALPAVRVPEALLHAGELTIRRSPLLDVRLLDPAGLTRTSQVGTLPAVSLDESPLRIRPFQAFRFPSDRYAARLIASPVKEKVTVQVQTLLNVGDRETTAETRLQITSVDRPLYAVRVQLPPGFQTKQVVGPGEFEWSVEPAKEKEKEPAVLTVVFTRGQDSLSLVVNGTFGPTKLTDGKFSLPAPRFVVLDADRQEGDLVVQSGPAFDLAFEGLKDSDTAALSTAFGWLADSQRTTAHARVLRYHAPQYAATVVLKRRPPAANVVTITNVKVTDRSIEETILLDFRIRDAGIRELSFLLPERLKDARINAALLRQVTFSPPEKGLVRVRLELQDEVLGQFLVVVEHDRMLTGEKHEAPLPVIEEISNSKSQISNFKVDNQFVLIQGVGRDEVTVPDDLRVGFDLLSRQQKQFRTLSESLANRFSGGIRLAYVAAADAKELRLVFQTTERKSVETVGARIGLSRTMLVVDGAGGYRATTVFKVANQTEQFLECILPSGAELWTAFVAGEAVKPASNGTDRTHVRLPLVKTAEGDADYDVVLKYGGRMPIAGVVGSADFPLVRTKNIAVELTQVQLFVPENRNWFDFGGTLRRVADRGEFEAAYVGYVNKQLENVSQTLSKSQDAFVRARASNNLKQLGLAIQNFRSVNPALSNEYLNKNIDSNTALLKQAQEQLESAQVDVVDGTDNRALFNDLIASQKTQKASGGQMGNNFVVESQPSSGPANGKEQFNREWFSRNSLANPKAPMDDKKLSRVVQSESEVAGGKSTGKGKANYDNRGNAPRFDAPNLNVQDAEKPMQQPAQQQLDQSAPNAQPQAQNEQQQAADRYQRRLDDQLRQQLQQQGQGQQLFLQPQPNAPVVQPPGNQSAYGYNAPFGATTPNLPPGTPPMPGADQPQQPGRSGGFAGGLPQTPPADAGVSQTYQLAEQPVTTLGLTSLDVDLEPRGREYFFTTPSGDAQITARAIDSSTQTRLLRLVLVALLGGVVWFGRRFVPNRDSTT